MLTLLALIGVVLVPRPPLLWLALGLVGISVALNAPILRFFAQRRGLLFAAKAWLIHQLHLAYGGATFAICALLHWTRRSPQRGTPIDRTGGGRG